MGTQTSGGGVVINSTQEQVNEALDLALRLATESDMSKNVFVQFWKDWGQTSKDELISKPSHLFSRADTTAKSGGETSPDDHFESPYLMALKRNKIARLASGDCLSPIVGRHTDASVSSLTVNADICFSIVNLMRVPPAALLREILSLVLHEATHLGGALEPEAVSWQQLFSSYFGARFGDLSTDIIAAETLKTLGSARIILAEAKDIALRNPQDPTLYERMGAFVQLLESLPELKDPLAFELKLKPKRPDLISPYSDSILGLVEEIRLKFEIGHDTLRVGGITVPINFMPPEKVAPTIDEVSEKFEKINRDFLILAGRTDFSGPVCNVADTPGLFPHVSGKGYQKEEFPPSCDQRY
jgi:hypothetical protein